MSNFVDFIVDASKNTNLGKDFITMLESAKSAEEVGSWLKGKGYDVSPSEVKRIFENKDSIMNVSDISVKAPY